MPIQVMQRQQEPRQQQEPKADIWDNLLKGLQIAGGVTNLAVDYQNFNSIRENRSRLETQDANAAIDRENLTTGHLNPMQQAGLAEKGFTPTDEKDPMGIGFTKGEDKAPVFYKPGMTAAQQSVAKDRQDVNKLKAIADREKLSQENTERLYDVGQDFGKHPVVRESQESFQTAEFVDTLLKEDVAVLDQIGLRKVFRLSGDVGAIRENDLKDLGADPSLIAQGQLMVSRLVEGQSIRPEERAALRKMSEMVKQMSRRNLNRTATDFAGKGAAKIKGMDAGEVLDYLNPDGMLSQGQFEFQESQPEVGGQSQVAKQQPVKTEDINAWLLNEKARRRTQAGGRN